jgi:hypothetical protein
VLGIDKGSLVAAVALDGRVRGAYTTATATATATTTATTTTMLVATAAAVVVS